MAERGGQPGNQNAAKAKRWEAAVVRALEAWPNKPDSTGCSPLMIGLNEAAHQFVKGTMGGELPFLKELGDRMDGKAAQTTTIAGDAENPVVITSIERRIVNAGN